MLKIDCAQCPMRLIACADCVVSYVLDHDSDQPMELDYAELAALHALAGAGMVPPLRGVATG